MRISDLIREAVNFDNSYRRPLPPTMATLPGPPSLVPPTNSYRDYLARAETKTFRGRYATVLALYSIDPDNAVAAPANVARMIYAAYQ